VLLAVGLPWLVEFESVDIWCEMMEARGRDHLLSMQFMTNLDESSGQLEARRDRHELRHPQSYTQGHLKMYQCESNM